MSIHAIDTEVISNLKAERKKVFIHNEVYLPNLKSTT